MFHVKDISAEGLDKMAERIIELLKVEYPVMFESDIEVECVHYSGVKEDE
jgi:hypothetical protein